MSTDSRDNTIIYHGEDQKESNYIEEIKQEWISIFQSDLIIIIILDKS